HVSSDDVDPNRACPAGKVAVRKSIQPVPDRESTAREKLTSDQRQGSDRINTTSNKARTILRNSIAQRGALRPVAARDIHGGDSAGIGKTSADIEIGTVSKERTHFGERFVVWNPGTMTAHAGAERMPLAAFPAGDVVDFQSVDIAKATADQDRIIA